MVLNLKQREMRDFLTLLSVAVGGILLAGGNNLGMLFLLPGIVYSIRTAE
jgi:hypothetical protein